MRGLLGLAFALALAGSAAAENITVIVPPRLALEPLPSGSKTQALSLTRVAANIPPGTAWNANGGELAGLCTHYEVEHWVEGNNKIAAIDTFDRIFREELKAEGFSAGGDPTNLFEDQGSSDLQVGALITKLQIKVCMNAGLIKYTLDGAAAMDVEWQIYSVSQAKVLTRITTNGGLTLRHADDLNSGPLITGAFADNVQRLTADQRFRKLVTAGPPTGNGSPAPALAAMRFTPGGRDVPIASAANGVVSIFAGAGMGSGVLISSEGYILTNHHVAGDSGQVRVRWADGSETIGDVVRADRRRDVALVRTSAPKTEALSIRHSPVVLGETVFAIGTPLNKKYAGTLTRGVVSANRFFEGQPWIQSDVAVDHGNSGGPLLDEKGRVLGLTDWRDQSDGMAHDLNFFVPIDDALRALALAPAELSSISPPAALPPSVPPPTLH